MICFSICERITPRLAHANAAVVLSAVKVLMKFMEMLPSDSDFVTALTKKLAPPLVTLLSSEPEVSTVLAEYVIFGNEADVLVLSILGAVCGITKYKPYCSETPRHSKT